MKTGLESMLAGMARVVVLLGTGCGPDHQDDGWIPATFSSPSAGFTGQAFAVTRYETHQDGTFVISELTNCGQNTMMTLQELGWSRIDAHRIEVRAAAGEDIEHDERWQLYPGGSCDEVLVDEFRDGTVFDVSDYAIGEVCMADLGDCGSAECDSCRAVWCDAAPEPCE